MIVAFLDYIIAQLSVVTCLAIAIAVFLPWLYFKNRDLPPGPWGVPILGYLPFLDANTPAEIQFHNISQKYGSVVSMQLGSHLVVVLDDFESIKEAFVKQGDNFAGRPQGKFIKVHDHDKGITNTDGEIWRNHRRFMLSTLRNFGVGKLSLEPQIMKEINFFLKEISKAKGQPIDDLDVKLGLSTANIISTMEFGKRFEYDDEKFAHLRHLMDELICALSATGARALFKWISYVPFSAHFTGQNFMADMQDNIRASFRTYVKEHQKHYQEGSRKDYIDAFITERNETIKRTDTEGCFDMNEELESNLQALFGAGTETVTATLRWAALMMMIYPEMQQKMQKEVDEVIGMERAPSTSDQKHMKYTDAFLLEVVRYGSTAPLNLPHSNIEETILKGYRIPKRSVIFTNLWAVHFDPKLWDDPDKFQPERFLKDGQVVKPEYLLPFSIGRRICPGEQLARMELFLYFTSILQRFTILPPGGKIPEEDNESFIVRRPKRFKIVAVERKGYHLGN